MGRRYLGGPPTAPEHFATKAYVDSLLPSGLTKYELDHDFTNDTAGTVQATADTGQTTRVTYNRIGAIPTIVGGRFTHTDTAAGTAAAYLTWPIAASVVAIEAEWEYGVTGSGNGQNAVVAAWETILPSGLFTTTPNTPCHITITPSFLQYWADDPVSGSLTAIGNIDFSPTLGVGPWRVRVVLDKANGVAIVNAPDGQIQHFYSPSINTISATFVSAEFFTSNANLDKRVNFKNFRASSNLDLLRSDIEVFPTISKAQLLKERALTTTYTAKIADSVNTVMAMNSASAQVITIPPNATVGFPPGATLEAMQVGAGQVSFAAGVGVTLQVPTGSTAATRAQWSSIYATQRPTVNTWRISGDMA